MIGGSVTGGGSLGLPATRVGSDTALAQSVQLMQMVQNSQASVQRLADKVASGHRSRGMGLLAFLIGLFVIGGSLLRALLLAVTVTVIACPEALGLATPTAVAVGTGMGGRDDILIKNATARERASRIQAIICDETGIRADGKPAITDLVVLAAGNVEILDEPHRWQAGATAEADSIHPLARTIGEEAAQRGLATLPYEEWSAALS